jgi:hypothetical protein
MLIMLLVEGHVYLFKFLLNFKLCMMLNWEKIDQLCYSIAENGSLSYPMDIQWISETRWAWIWI